eukprot:TRINITY_DN2481_c0_g1_i3.p1 TRINITY_DN2481_c0_g1~~TRINITY_DN2481_c0_g1_i3.p1  ORF type:complete len:297 (-),score=60.84 TRINITY_DN2481_c0_g1_i3:46-864(-)
MSYNVWCHYTTLAPNKQMRMESFVACVRALEVQPDVIVFQELFAMNMLGMRLGGDVKDYIVKELNTMGYTHVSAGKIPTFGQSNGLLIASKHPIIASEERTWYAIDDFGTGKGYIHVTLSVNDNKVHIYNLHLDAHRAGMRSTQISELVQTLPNKEEHIILAGDFNIDASKSTFLNGGNPFSDSAAAPGAASGSSASSGEEFDSLVATLGNMRYAIPREKMEATHPVSARIIDHIFASPSLTVNDGHVVKFTDRYQLACSDHIGLRATFEFY